MIWVAIEYRGRSGFPGDGQAVVKDSLAWSFASLIATWSLCGRGQQLDRKFLGFEKLHQLLWWDSHALGTGANTLTSILLLSSCYR